MNIFQGHNRHIQYVTRTANFSAARRVPKTRDKSNVQEGLAGLYIGIRRTLPGSW